VIERRYSWLKTHGGGVPYEMMESRATKNLICKRREMINKKKICNVLWVGFLLLALLAVVVGGCAKSEPTTSEPTTALPKHLKVGVIMPVSGFLSVVGLGWARGYELYFNKVNEQGGLKIGDDTYLIDVLVEDDMYSPEAATTAATKLVYDDEVKFLFGGMGSEPLVEAIYGVTSAVDDVMFLPAWLPNPGGSMDVSLDKPLVARPTTGAAGNVRAIYDYLLEVYPDVESVVMVIPETPLNFLGFYESVMEEHGLDVVGVEYFSMATVDFTPLWTRVLEYDADVAHIVMSGQVSPQIKVAREMGFNGVIISDSPESPNVMVEIAGAENCTDIISGGLDSTGPDATAGMQEVVERWEETYTEEFGEAGEAWDEAWFLVQAIEKAQSIDPAAVIEAIETMTEPGSVETIYGLGYVAGAEVESIGVNRVLYKPYPISHVVDGVSQVVKWVMPDYTGYFTNPWPWER
jgi:branched-chain amino acid transport system substrate-binding protein